MLSQSISSFADILANFTNVCYVQVCFTMPLHISTVREPFTAGGTSVFHVDGLVSCTLGHNDHGVKDSGQGLCGQWCQREITRIDYCLWYTAWCCLKALLVLKLFWQTGHSMIMSTWVSQCLRMSFFDGIVFPHVEHVQLPSPKFWHIIESSMRLSSKYKQHHFKVKEVCRPNPIPGTFRIYGNLIGHIPGGTDFPLVIKGVMVGQAASRLETLLLANATGMQEIQMGFNVPPQIFLSCHRLATRKTLELHNPFILLFCHHWVQAGIEVWEKGIMLQKGRHVLLGSFISLDTEYQRYLFVMPVPPGHVAG